MRDHKCGRIITIGSINGQKGQFAQENYAVSKAGDLGMTKSLAHEVARMGNTANAICPGDIGTDMVMALSEKSMNRSLQKSPPVAWARPKKSPTALYF